MITGHTIGPHADLRGANLYGANLYGADLRGANLRGANLHDADLRGANLYSADLHGANLYGADLHDANLYAANLYAANLYGADLRGANLRGANLYSADLRGAKNIPAWLSAVLMVPPEKGSYTAFKKCRDDLVVELLIPAKARRSSATTRKCRASEAKVIAISGGKKTAKSLHDATEYHIGKTVKCHEWDGDRWNECSGGIHHFITRAEAEAYR